MQVGTDVWVKNVHLDMFNNDPWLPSTVLSKVVSPDGEVTVSVTAAPKGKDDTTTYIIPRGQFDLPDLKFRNSTKHQLSAANLNSLCFLNEPELLTALRARYHKNVLSTFVGQVLVHINPLRAGVNVEEGGGSGAEGDSVIEKFAFDVKSHAAFAPEAWEKALLHMKAKERKASLDGAAGGTGGASGGLLSLVQSAQAAGSDDNKSQILGHSIIINGESGSGKTETARALLKSLLKSSTTAPSQDTLAQQGALVERIVHATTLLDALGNARLQRNLNSSRYGKYLELGFDRAQTLAGAHIRTYLLESVLVCNQSAEESNFHVFYQLVRGSKATERVKWGLSGDCEAYTYLSGEAAANGTGTNESAAETRSVTSVPADADTAAQERDVQGFQALKDSLSFLGVSAEDTHQFFATIAAILHLGQLRFDTVTDLSGDSSAVRDRQPLELAARLLGVSPEQLETALVRKKSLVIRGEVILKALSAAQAATTRDAIARSIYKRVFEWALGRANQSLHPHLSAGTNKGVAAKQTPLASCVGILDIFGFENVNCNSFEQLCINYSAEVLHKHFCETVFAQELVEYQQQGVRFEGITFRRSAPLIKMLGTELMGILDEQVRQPHATDAQFLSKLNKKFGSTSAVALASGGRAAIRLAETDLEDRQFRVAHYACEVTYSVAGFLEKHFDEVPAAVERMLQSSTSVVLNSLNGSNPSGTTKADVVLHPVGLSTNHNASFSTNTVRRSQNVNLGAYFKAQLTLLLEQVRLTVPHFVRCIKASEKALASGARRASNGAAAAAAPSTSKSVLNNPLLNKGKSKRLQGSLGAPAPVAANYAGLNTAFNPLRVLEQLRSAGLIDAIAVTRQHFRVKAPLLDFYQRYRSVITPDHPLVEQLPRFLKSETHDEAAVAKCTSVLVEALLTSAALVAAVQSSATTTTPTSTTGSVVADAMHWQLGTSAVYLTVADHELLETARFAVLEVAGVVLAHRINVYKKRWTFLRAVNSVRLLQRVARGNLARKEAHKRKQFLNAVVSLQRRFRNQIYVNDLLVKLRYLVKALLTVQKCARRFCARRMVLKLKLARERYLATSGNLLIAKEIRLARRRGEIEVVREPIPAVELQMADYRSQETVLLSEINTMIHGTKVTSQSALVKFEVKETRRVLTEWASVSTGNMKALLLKLANKVDFGYKLLRPAELIPAVKSGWLFAFRSAQQHKKASVRVAEKNITKEHAVFSGVARVQLLIEELLRVAFNERKEALSRIDAVKKDLVRNIRKFGPEFSRTKATPYYAEIQKEKDFIVVADNIMRFGLVLYKYYQGFIGVVVQEYGQNSVYRRNFAEDETYLLSLQQLIETSSEPIHYLEQFLQMSNADPSMDVCADFPLKLADGVGIAAQQGSLARGQIQLYNDVYYRFMPYAPGLDFAVNSFQQFLSPHSISPSRLLRLSGKSTDNYGQCTYYQASQGFSEQSLSDVLANPVLIEKLHFTSTSSAIIASLLTGAGDCRPENFMVRFVREKGAYGAAGEVERVELLGVCTDSVYEKTAFSYARIADAYSNCKPPSAEQLLALRETGVRDVGVGFNCLFFLPQMDEPVDPEIATFFRSTPTVPEEVVCSWLKFLFQQNRRFEALKVSGGFTAQDFETLHLPIQIPLGAAIRLLQRLQELREHLNAVDADRLTHHALLSFWYPELGEFYKDWRFSSNRNHITDADMEMVPTATAEDVSMLPLDHDDPTDRSIREEVASSGKGISRRSKRAFFFALTPYHKLYQTAVAKVEAEVTALLGAKARAAALASGQLPGAAGEGGSESSSGSSSDSDGDLEIEMEDEDTVEENEGEEGGDKFDSTPRSSPRTGTNSPRSRPQSAARPRPQSVEHGFHNIYDQDHEHSDGEEDQYYFEDAPSGLRKAHGQGHHHKHHHKRPVSKGRNDEKNQSFYKHKLAQAQEGPPLSPLVTHDLYPQQGLSAESSPVPQSGDPRFKSMRLDSLYSEKDFDHDGNDFSEAEQTVMYLKSGDKTAPTALLSPMVAQGSNPMAGLPANKKVNVFPATQEVLGANPMARGKPTNAVSRALNGESAGGIAMGGEGEEDWRVEDAVEEGNNSEESGSDQGSESEAGEDNGEDVSAATPSPIAEVALQFLISLDFRRFDIDASRRICRIIGDSMAFLETLWLRYISEDQLRFMFEGYYELKRNHRVASALTTTTGAVDVLGSSARGPTDIYATKEIKLIGISTEIFKRLQRTTTINRLRRILGIQVSLVVIDEEDDSFTNVLSGGSSSSSVSFVGRDSPLPPSSHLPSGAQAVPASDSLSVSAASVDTSSTPARSVSRPGQWSEAEVESDEDTPIDELERRSARHVDFPDRYNELKRRTKLALGAYTNMVGSVAPELISHNSTIVREVVRLSATVKGAKSLNVTLANQFGLIFLDFPGFARIGKELADRGVFNQTNRIIHRLLSHAQIDRYVDVIHSILEQTPSVLLLRDRGDNFLPCDRVKALPDSKLFKYALLARFINAIPNINADYAAAHHANVVTPVATKKAGPAGSGTSTPVVPEADKLTGDEEFLSMYAGDEELIVRALHFNLQASVEEVKSRKFDLRKVDPASGDSVFHKCILCYADEPFVYNSAIETFRIALRVLKERCIGAELTQLSAEKLLFTVTNRAGHTAWDLAVKHNTRPMIEAIVADWTKTNEAPASAIALSPAGSKRSRHISARVSGDSTPHSTQTLSPEAAGTGAHSSRSAGLAADLALESMGDEGESGDNSQAISAPSTFDYLGNASTRSSIRIDLLAVEDAEEASE